MSRRIGYALSLVVLAAVTAAPARAAADTELEGVYLAEGVNPDGTEYRGFVQITREGATFFVSWTFPEASPDSLRLEIAAVGVGLVGDGILAVSYYTPESAGVAIYRIEDEGQRLAGRWTSVDVDGVRTETLTKLPAVSEPAAAEPPPDAAPRRWRALDPL